MRYGGIVIGALAARWPTGTPYDLSRAAIVLTMAATAVGPVLSSAAGRRSRRQAPERDPLLGVSPQMVELRGAIERAAPSPFSVLIEAIWMGWKVP